MQNPKNSGEAAGPLAGDLVMVVPLAAFAGAGAGRDVAALTVAAFAGAAAVISARGAPIAMRPAIPSREMCLNMVSSWGLRRVGLGE
jgi:hypothetical protein